jgi:2-polyprenyl-6-methoxyphenol hydroxylase-like FAD-dependent oxidoreductase
VLNDSATRSGRRSAVVLGGGMAGLLAAAALSEAFDTVTIVDRDDLTTDTQPRGGVPQGRHVHALLARGTEALEQLLPGVLEQFVSAGALSSDALGDTTWYVRGRTLHACRSGLRVISASRPLLETIVRSRVAALGNVRLRSQTSVLGLVTAAGCVRGVRLFSRNTGAPVVLTADLVVDATGRASRAPEWLDAMGFPRPREERREVNLTYASCIYRVPSDVMRGRFAVICPATPRLPRGAIAQAIENDAVLVSFSGYRGYEPQATLDGLLAHAASLPDRTFEGIVRRGEPLREVAGYVVTANVRRYYEELRSFPDGFVVTGDAVCAFNPSYAQGMTVAALEALLLGKSVQATNGSPSARFFRDITPIVNGVWMVGTANDLQIPTIAGARPLKVRLLNLWLQQLIAAAEHDAELSRLFAGVASLVDSPEQLRTAAVLKRVLMNRLGWKRGTALADVRPAVGVPDWQG